MSRYAVTCALLFTVASFAAQHSSAQAPAVAPSPDPLAAQVQSMQGKLNDWALLSRYSADNATLPPPAGNEQRVVFMGDSITDGWGRRPGTGEFFPGKPYVNRGISGQTTPQMLVRFQQDVIRLRPAAVLLLGGTNDIAGNTGPSTPQMTEDNIASMAAIAQQNGVQVVLASITPVGSYPWKPAVPSVAPIRVINSWIRSFCTAHGYIYLDYYDALATPDGAMKPGLSFDGVHPNAAGYAIMAPLAEQAIVQALTPKP